MVEGSDAGGARDAPADHLFSARNDLRPLQASGELGSVAGVEAVEVDLDTKLVIVAGESLDDLIGAVEAAGYRAALAETLTDTAAPVPPAGEAHMTQTQTTRAAAREELPGRCPPQRGTWRAPPR